MPNAYQFILLFLSIAIFSLYFDFSFFTSASYFVSEKTVEESEEEKFEVKVKEEMEKMEKMEEVEKRKEEMEKEVEKELEKKEVEEKLEKERGGEKKKEQKIPDQRTESKTLDSPSTLQLTPSFPPPPPPPLSLRLFALGGHNMIGNMWEMLVEEVGVEEANFYDKGPYCKYGRGRGGEGREEGKGKGRKSKGGYFCWNPVMLDPPPPRTPEQIRAMGNSPLGNRIEKKSSKAKKRKNLVKVYSEKEKRIMADRISELPEFKKANFILCVFPVAFFCQILERKIRKKDKNEKDAKNGEMYKVENTTQTAEKKFLIIPGWRVDHSMPSRNDSCFWTLQLIFWILTKKGFFYSISIFDYYYSQYILGDASRNFRTLKGGGEEERAEENVEEVETEAGKAAEALRIPYIDVCVSKEYFSAGKEFTPEAKGSNSTFLFFPGRATKKGLNEFNLRFFTPSLKIVNKDTPILLPVRSVYPSYSPSSLLPHRGIVWLPYAPVVCTLVEHYMAGIPIWVPSLTLMVEWLKGGKLQMEEEEEGWRDGGKTVMYELINPPSLICPLEEAAQNEEISGRIDFSEDFFPKQHTRYRNSSDFTEVPPPPQSIFSSPEAAKFWLKFSFFYKMPFFNYFSSATDLKRQLKNFSKSKYDTHSKKQSEFAAKYYEKVVKEWKKFLTIASVN